MAATSDASSSSSSSLPTQATAAPPPAVTGTPPSIIDDAALLDQILEVAIDAAKKAGAIIIEHAGGVDVMKNKANARDLLTQIDPLCEQTIRDTVLHTFADHDFLGEEDVPPGKEASEAALQQKLRDSADTWLWIVDPIDGTSVEIIIKSATLVKKGFEANISNFALITFFFHCSSSSQHIPTFPLSNTTGTTNFVHGMPMNMPSIAATYQGQIMVAVIYDSHRDELYTAVRGRGAHCNGQPITVDCISPSTLEQAVVAMGSPPGEESMQMSMAGVQALMPRVRTLRMLGSAALMLAWVAHGGRLTAYWEYDLSAWDTAGGALIITEAGGVITDLEGKPYTLATRKICASNGGAVHEELLRVLREEAGIV